MAQTGYTPISIYYSSTASATPTAGNLVAGELAINTADGKLFYKDSAGVVQVIGTKGGVGSSSNTQVLYNSSGLVVGSANLTFNGTTLTLANDASISGLTVGKGGGAGNNTTLGYQALATNTAGNAITAIGYQALNLNTANNITAVGYKALATNSTGTLNTGIGGFSLYSTTTGGSNTALGWASLYVNTTGANNIAIGVEALQANTTASYNTAVGYQALYTNTGAQNTAFGTQALYSTTTQNYITAVGYQTGYSNTTGSVNAFGHKALYANTTGNANSAFGGYDGVGGSNPALFSNTTGSANSAFGVGALASNTTASNNTAVGYQSLYTSNRTADTNANNTALGYQAGYALTTGQNNTIVGYQALNNYTGAGGNTVIGYQSGTALTTGFNNTIIGSFGGNSGGLDIRTASNYIVLSDGAGNPRGYFNDVGRFFVTGSVNNDNVTYIVNSNATPSGLGIGFSGAAPNNTTQYAIQFGDTSSYRFRVWSNGNVVNSNNSYGSISDVKLKENIVDATPKLDKLMDVKVRNYNLIGETTKQIGVVAQELETVFPSMIDVSPDLDEKGNDLGTTTKSVKYSVFVPILIKAIQELKAEVDSLKQQLGK